MAWKKPAPIVPGSCCAGLASQTDLWANDNQIENLDEVEAALRPFQPTLSCLYLKVRQACTIHGSWLQGLRKAQAGWSLHATCVCRATLHWRHHDSAKSQQSVACLGTAPQGSPGTGGTDYRLRMQHLLSLCNNLCRTFTPL